MLLVGFALRWTMCASDVLSAVFAESYANFDSWDFSTSD